ncbi:ABC transporter ATP-binding protein [Mesobacillus zeae]|uniref:Carnitine transport ATP-binding protein OpuCA n=1 Tax=Mesobacillus zeae TaxID=1917180 RepID=A0A398BDH3_9BACI|nr:ABC transporter ATP-binding protein [Mesobacillus zeae]RID85706.1 ABC transporter ATP-binding protein [Mesobacillus zeae]
MIRFENVIKTYPDGTEAIKPLNLEIKKGEFFVLIGPSGSGKTTSLKMINRLIDLSEGTIYINGKKISEYNIHELRWNIGYVLQQIALFPHMTIEENIAVVPELKKWEESKISKRIDELLEMVGLNPETYRNRMPHELSGGQQQRVGVVRALAADPEILLMDEPFSALDPISREKLQDDILTLQRKINKTIVFVTHDIEEALKLGDRICVMRDGEAIQTGTPEELLDHPVDPFIPEFIGTRKVSFSKNESIEGLLDYAVEELPEHAAIKALPLSASISEVLSCLEQEKAVRIMDNGQFLGVMTRESVISYLSGKLKKGGFSHE